MSAEDGTRYTPVPFKLDGDIIREMDLQTSLDAVGLAQRIRVSLEAKRHREQNPDYSFTASPPSDETAV
ncbi:MAG: hypothetical protein WDN27_04115 [Candidatus Saccharibacteria bacterium]